jgi:hypothetical protein
MPAPILPKYLILSDSSKTILAQHVNEVMSVTYTGDPDKIYRPLGNPEWDGSEYFQALTLFY